MAVCKFFLQGNCKFGDRCKFEHRRDAGPPNQPRNQPNSNRFGSLEDRINSGPPPRNNNFSNFSNRGRGGGFQPRGGGHANQRSNRNNNQNTYGLNDRIFQLDLKFDKPLWPMSCYGSADRDAPKLLMGEWPIELSPEELRVEHYLSLARGNQPEDSAPAEQELMTMANQQMENVLNDPSGAIDFVIAGEKEHPNRRDIQIESTKGHQHGLFSVANQRNRRGVFQEQPRPPREQNNPRNAPNGGGFKNAGFNPTSGPRGGQNHFGQSPQLGNTGNPGLGQPTGFGQPAQPTQAGAFAAPSQFGQPAQNTFGTGFHNAPSNQTQQPNNAFGQSQQSGLSKGPNAFGQQPSNPPGGNAFGRQEETMQTNPIAPNSFGAPNNFLPPNQPQGNALFGNGNPAQQPSSFGNINRNPQASGMGGMANGIGGGPNPDVPAGLTGERHETPQLREAYAHLAKTGQFKDDAMPETAPLDDWLNIE